MSEDQELQARIAALSGRINLHKQSAQPDPARPVLSSNGICSPPRVSHTFRKAPDQDQGSARRGSTWVPHRGTPYGNTRGRGGRTLPPTHRNRSLVLNTNHPGQGAAPVNDPHPATPSQSASPAVRSAASTPMFVSKRDRHMQLINTNVFDRLSLERTKEMEKTAEQRRHRRNLREMAKLGRHFDRVSHPYSSSTRPKSQQEHTIDIDNVRFRVADGGSKLLRMSNDSTTARATPKRARVGGVTFLRSKNGNLYRAGLIDTKKIGAVKKTSGPCPRFTATGSPFPSMNEQRNKKTLLFTSGLYPWRSANTWPGTCPRGPSCRHVHDPKMVAICKDFLQKGTCPAGDACDLSHEPTAERVPACVHFLRGHCTNERCRYAHVRVNPGAPVCRGFATLGYCGKGNTCVERHVSECPDYANKGVCRNSKCRLPHVDRAGQIRKAAVAQAAAAPADEDESPDLTSDEDDYGEIDSEDVDSDGLDQDTVMPNAANDRVGLELTEQQDFVQF